MVINASPANTENVTESHAPIPATRRAFRPSRRVWWAVSIVILLAGAVIHLTGYNFQLPYVSTIDEVYLFLDSMIQHGTYTLRPAELRGYPPGVYALDNLAQDVVLATTHGAMIDHMADAISLARLASACVTIVTGLIMGLLARALAGDWAGWLAMCWLLLPESTYYDVTAAQAMPQAWLVFFWALALLWAVIGLKRRSVIWPVLSVLAGLAAILFKYSEFPSVIPGLLVPFWHLYNERRLQVQPTRRRWLGVFLVQTAGCAAVAMWLLFGYRMSSVVEISPPVQQFLSNTGVSKLLDGSQLAKAVQATFTPFMLPPLVIGLFLVVGTVLYLRRGKMIFAWALVAGATAAIIGLVAVYSPYDFNLPRYTAPACMSAAVLLAISVAIIAEWLIAKARKSATGGVRLLLVGSTAIWLVVVFSQAWTVASARAAPDTRAALAVWAVDNLLPGNVLVDPADERIFNKEFGGYEGMWRQWWAGDIRNQPLQVWRSQGYAYAVIPEDTAKAIDPASYGSQILPLKLFPPSDSPTPAARWQGPRLVVYQLTKPQYPVNRVLGSEIELVGYDVSSRDPHPGDVVSLTLYWHPVQIPKDNYNVFIHIYLPGAQRPQIVTQTDGAPTTSKRPTLSWTDLNETLVSQPFHLSLPPNVSPGCYPLVVGLYNYQTGQRLMSDGQDSIELTRLCVGAESF